MKLLTALLFALPVFVLAQVDVFPRALRQGVRGEDVRELQLLLNSDAETRVASAGPGSSGSETDYFGPATKRAVVKFQEKYRAEILTPSSLSSGTGFFGEITRAKANALSFGAVIPKENPIPPSTETTVGLPVAPDDLKGVVVKTPSRYFAKPGTAITISGWGFAKENNTINFGDSYKVENVKSDDGYSLVFNVPNIPKGVYIVSVKNANGNSQTKTFFAITDGKSTAPSIESITPEHATRGDTVIIKGSGLARTGNMLRTSLKVFENLSSADGATISFVIPADTFSYPPTGFAIPSADTTIKKAAVSLPIWIYVVNENGLSNGKSFIGDF